MEHVYNKGIYATMITPFCKDGSIDYETARRYVRWYGDHGCDGIFAVCQSSEIFFLSEDERVLLNKVVWQEARKYREETGKRLTIVSSGHTSVPMEDQIRELTRVYEGGTDALILITNRLDPENLGDDIWIANAGKLLDALPKEVALGLYECPVPYKRLLTPRILKWCLSTGRFRFIKDTCCDAAVIRERMKILRGIDLMLFNANGQTLLSSLEAGASGYCGIMANFHPELYALLYDCYVTDPALAQRVQSYLSVACATEGVLPYPLSAKYHMTLRGIPTENIARSRNSSDLTDYFKMCTEQLKTASEFVLNTVLQSK